MAINPYSIVDGIEMPRRAPGVLMCDHRSFSDLQVGDFVRVLATPCLYEDPAEIDPEKCEWLWFRVDSVLVGIIAAIVLWQVPNKQHLHGVGEGSRFSVTIDSVLHILKADTFVAIRAARGYK